MLVFNGSNIEQESHRILGGIYDSRIKTYLIELIRDGEKINDPCEYIELDLINDSEQIQKMFKNRINEIYNSLSDSYIDKLYSYYEPIINLANIIDEHGMPELYINNNGIRIQSVLDLYIVDDSNMELRSGNTKILFSISSLLIRTPPNGIIVKNLSESVNIYSSDLKYTGVSLYWRKERKQSNTKVHIYDDMEGGIKKIEKIFDQEVITDQDIDEVSKLFSENYKNSTARVREKKKFELDNFDGTNLYNGRIGKHKGLTKLRDGRYAVILAYDDTRLRTFGYVVSDEQALEEIKLAKKLELLENIKYQELKRML